MVWRALLFGYLCLFGSLLWLLWAVVQTVLAGRARHNRVSLGDPAKERLVRSNCFFWALRRLVWEGGELRIRSSPRLPVWRAEWIPAHRKWERWHFEPEHPMTGVRGVWHAFYHLGRPRLVGRGAA